MPVEKKGNKGSSTQDYGYFKIDGDKVTRTKKYCSRYGKRVYMSENKDRHTWGKLGLTNIKHKK